MAVQLIPLPPRVWPAIPGREPFAATYAAAGIALPWLPLSLDSSATIASGLALLPPAAMFLAASALAAGERLKLGLVVILLAFLSVFLGLMQITQGTLSPLRFYSPTDPNAAVGFFANSNHYAAFLCAAMPLSAAAAVATVHERRLGRAGGVMACAFVYAVLILGVALADSRAGLLLGLGAGAGSLAIIWSGGLLRWHARRAAAVGAGFLVVAVLAQVLLLALARMASFSDAFRLQMYTTTLAAAHDFLPFGSGFGTFDPIYRIYEEPTAMLRPYVNHAHNDWLELLLEGGLPAAVLALAGLAWFVRTTPRIWGSGDQGHALHRLLAKAGWIIVALLLFHSALDYPLRTTANAVAFAFACALLLPPPDSARGGDKGRDPNAGRASGGTPQGRRGSGAGA